MKKLIAVVVVVSLVILAYRLITPVKPPENFSETKSLLQKAWSAGDQLAIGSEKLAEGISEAVRTNGTELTASQQELLVASLKAWMHALKSGDFEDFMAFRKPDTFQFNDQQVAYVSGKIFGDTNLLHNLPNRDKAQKLFEFFNRLRFEGVSASSIQITVRRTSSEPKGDIVSPFGYYPGGVLNLHAPSPFRYRANPAALQKSHGEILWAGCSFAFAAPDRPDELIPVTIAFYWSPSSGDWKPAECYLTSLHRPGDTGPALMFYF